MPTELDPNQIAANVVTQQIASIADFAGAQLGKLVGGAQVQFRLGLKKYLNDHFDRLSQVKTLLHRDSPVPIDKIYVELLVKSGKKIVADSQLSNEIEQSKFAVIVGTAGSGKSMLMRHLFLRALRNKTKVPVFLELRQLNAISVDTDFELAQALVAVLGRQAPFSVDQLALGMRKGIFTFYFDGFDEVNPSQREYIEKLILTLSIDYAGNEIVVSSRPDDTFDSWNAFHVFHVQPLSSAQVQQLIGKLDYDEEVKRKFISEIEETLFEKHPEFLSNPLLATMMLLTFDQFADIPSKVHVFYQQAFETLFQKHDALKAVYKRQNYSGLAIDEFKRVFAAFCALTYLAQQLSFDDSDARSFVDKAVKLSGVLVRAEDFLRDMLESVCVIQREGLNLIFAHRSFQEYFTAYFAVQLNADRAGDFIDLVLRKGRRADDVMALSLDMNAHIFETQWAAAAVNRLEKLIGADAPYEIGRVVAPLFEEVALSIRWQGSDGVEFDAFYKEEEESVAIAEARTLMRLYGFKYGFQTDLEPLRHKDTAVFARMFNGDFEVEDATEDFENATAWFRKFPKWDIALGGLTDGDDLYDDIVIVTQNLRHPTNLAWLRESSVDDVTRELWRWAREAGSGIRKRNADREEWLSALFDDRAAD